MYDLYDYVFRHDYLMLPRNCQIGRLISHGEQISIQP